MPVPVPRLSKPLAHPVIKRHRLADPDHINSFQNLTRTLPVSPTGPPPSFGTREQWINSLPSWRRTKPRRIWEDDSRFAEGCDGQGFQQGLIVADNASVIKGARAQACIPPLFTLFQDPSLSVVSPATHFRQGCDGDADDEMSSDCSVLDQGQYDNESQWTASSPVRCEVGMDVEVHTELVWGHTDPAVVYHEQLYERGAFTPIFEDESGVQDVASSPMEPEPVTPFGDFVDRAVAADAHVGHDNGYVAVGPGLPEPHYDYHDKFCGPQCYLAQPCVPFTEQVKEAPAPAPAPEPVITPSATAAYKRLAEPLADWVANYVWKFCTTGTNLPHMPPGSLGALAHYPIAPPDYLSASIHSLLLSTLLQPSAVFLAVWYIVRLPVFFGGSVAADHVKELRFRVELLGECCGDLDREAMEASAPFRLVLLGCMLANKWLDDHTFSNKTWHSISNVPIHSLNKLESLTLEIFSYDLSIPAPAWSRWLADVLQYHLSLSSPSYPQPISRPSSNPHLIVRLAIEELIQAPVACDHAAFSSRPEPVFLGLDERRKEKSEKEKALAETCVDVLEIDLDEDGPLREEYLPKRRVSGAGSIRSCDSADSFAPRVVKVQEWEKRSFDMEKHLPPPAKWSPSGDEPILREKTRDSGRYVAVQAPRLNAAVSFFVSPPPYRYQMHDIGYQNLPSGDGYLAVNQPSATSYAHDLDLAQPIYNPYPFLLPISSHSRSHSSHDPDNSQSHNHTRSYSQSRVEYSYSDIRMTANELGPARRADARWSGTHYGYAPYSNAYTLPPSVNYQPTWLRT